MLDDGELIGLEATRMGRYETDPLSRVGRSRRSGRPDSRR